MAKDEERHPKTEGDTRHMLHVHTFLTETDVEDEHQHAVLGVSGPAREQGVTHIHRVRSRTTYLAEGDGGHWHWFDVMTGPAVDMPDGTHTHYFNGTTSINDEHSHAVADVTGLGPNQDMDDEDDDDCEDDRPIAKNQKYKRAED